MSVQTGGPDLETAAAQADIGGATQTENAKIFEATEDREVHWVLLDMNKVNCAAEVSFNAEQLLDGDTIDETASGVLAVFRPGAADNATAALEGQVVTYESAPPQWDAGEEISLHVNNFETAQTQVRVVIGYVPIGDFDRQTLRNR